jgi:hypothetical protein
LNDALRERKKSEKRSLRRRQQTKESIKGMELNLKDIMESVERQKQSTAKLMKVSQIKEEIQKISHFD